MTPELAFSRLMSLLPLRQMYHWMHNVPIIYHSVHPIYFKTTSVNTLTHLEKMVYKFEYFSNYLFVIITTG